MGCAAQEPMVRRLAAGESRIRTQATGLPVSIAEDPLTCVALGSGRALEEMKTLENVLINTW
jgi:actin-like ATPase involved in cell morphogenesis